MGHPGEETDSDKGGEGKEEEGVQEQQDEETGPGDWEEIDLCGHPGQEAEKTDSEKHEEWEEEENEVQEMEGIQEEEEEQENGIYTLESLPAEVIFKILSFLNGKRRVCLCVSMCLFVCVCVCVCVREREKERQRDR